MEFEIRPINREITIDGFNSIYYFEFGKDFSHPPEMHDFWEMVYVDGGEIISVTDGLGRTLSQGQVIFHRPMEIHAHVSNKVVPNNMLVVSFTSKSPAMEFFDKKIFSLDKTGKTLLTLFINEAKNALGEISGEYDNKNPLDFSSAPFGSLQLLECYLTEFLLILSRRNDDTGTKVIRSNDAKELAQSSLTELIITYLKESLYEGVTLSDICKKFFMGKSQLCKLFGEYVGESPIEYYAKLKTAEAKKLLIKEELSISTISDMLGYSSVHNFSRAFKKAVGFSPAVYRRKINHPDEE
ncbi:MAG: helix-turn-helix domain-containing protein [Clostridia bacterium]|nr:helix-turn-helix domain-containing protein [Clostridia bacterium]